LNPQRAVVDVRWPPGPLQDLQCYYGLLRPHHVVPSNRADNPIALISLAYLEEDGLLLSIALLASVVVLAVELVAVWETIVGAKWIFGLWY